MSDCIQILHGSNLISLPNDSQGIIAKNVIDTLTSDCNKANEKNALLTDSVQRLEKSNADLLAEVESLKKANKVLSDSADSPKAIRDSVKTLLEMMGCSEEEMESMDLSDMGKVAKYLKEMISHKGKKDWLDKEVTERLQTYQQIIDMIAPSDRAKFPFEPTKEPHEIKRDFLVFQDPSLKSELFADGISPSEINGQYRAYLRFAHKKVEPKTEEQRKLIDLMPRAIADGKGGVIDARDPEAFLRDAQQKRIKEIEAATQGGK